MTCLWIPSTHTLLQNVMAHMVNAFREVGYIDTDENVEEEVMKIHPNFMQ